MELTSGRVVGFEALARLRNGNVFYVPKQFMAGLSDAARVVLFSEMLRQANGFVTEARKHRPELFVSINVETSIVMRDDFSNLVNGCLGSDSVKDARPVDNDARNRVGECRTGEGGRDPEGRRLEGRRFSSIDYGYMLIE